MVQNCGEGIQDEEDEVITCSGKNDTVEKEMPLHYDQNEVIISSFNRLFVCLYVYVCMLHRYMYMHRKGIIVSHLFYLKLYVTHSRCSTVKSFGLEKAKQSSL